MSIEKWDRIASHKRLEFGFITARCGAALHLAKEQLGHGNFIPWVEKNFPKITVRTAQSYMQVAESVLLHLGFKCEGPSYLGLIDDPHDPKIDGVRKLIATKFLKMQVELDFGFRKPRTCLPSAGGGEDDPENANRRAIKAMIAFREGKTDVLMASLESEQTAEVVSICFDLLVHYLPDATFMAITPMYKRHVPLKDFIEKHFQRQEKPA